MSLQIYAYINLFTSFACVALAILLLAGGGIKRKTNISFSAMSITTAIWQFGLYRHTLSITYADSMYWSIFLHSFAILIPPLYLVFVMSMLGISRRLFVWTMFILAFVLMSMNIFTRDFIARVAPISGFLFFPMAGKFYILYLWEYLVCFLLPIYWLSINIKKEKGNRRQQLILLFMSTIVGVIGSSSTFLPVYGVPLFPYANCFTWLFTLILAYAITKTKFLNISIIISKSFAYGATIIVLGSLYLAFAIPYRMFVSSSIDVGFLSMTVAYGIFTGFCFERLRMFIQTSSDKVFLSGRYELKKALSYFVEKLFKIVSLEQLRQLFDDARTEIVESKVLSLFIVGIKENVISLPEELIEYFCRHKNGIVLVSDAINKVPSLRDVPGVKDVEYFVICRSQDNLIAVLVVGKKLSEDPFRDEEIETFKILAPQIAAVIERISPYEKVKADYKTAQEIAERAQHMAMLGQIALQAGHEIKNPIAAINLHTELLRKHLGDREHLEKYIELVQRNSKKIEDIVDKMKELGIKSDEKMEPLDLMELLEKKVLFLLAGYLNKKEIKVVKDLLPLPRILGAASSLEKAFVNIVLNAIEAMGTGGTLTLRAAVDGSNVRVIISDTGCGIPPENLNKIYLPMFTTRHEGTGLGLSITYKTIVEQHKGSIDVKSPSTPHGVNKGTEVIVCLPV